MDSKEVLFGLYNDEDDLVRAIKNAKSTGLEIMDVFTPFPLHAVDQAMEFEESRLHMAGFVYGMMGTATAFGFMTWVFTRDWPIIFGGKPYFSAPSFIPITFELTVLFASVGMVVTFYTICGLAPSTKDPVILDKRITDDKFCLAFDVTGMQDDEEDKYVDFLRQSGADEVHTKNI